MIYLIVALIGIVQGVSEFLPISSSGHLVLLYNIFDIQQNTIFLSVVLHLATLFAVVFVYFNDIVMLIKNPFCKTNKLLVVATIPTVIMVLIFEKLITQAFGGNFFVVGFFITALVLLISEQLSKKNVNTKSDVLNLDITYKKAIVIGVVQGIACVPGISRSGSTISTALMLKVNKEDATKFSFLMSIPIIIASFLYELINLKNATFSFSTMQLFVGFVCAFLFGIIAVKFMIKFVKKQKLYIFSIYLVIIGIFVLLNEYLFHLW